MEQIKETEVIRLAPSNTSGVGAGGRIPLATTDNLPKLWISVQMARQISNRLGAIVDDVAILSRKLDHYSSSSQHILELTKEHDNEAVANLVEQHERLLGGTMHTMLSSMISSLRNSLNELDVRLGNRSKKEKPHG